MCRAVQTVEYTLCVHISLKSGYSSFTIYTARRCYKMPKRALVVQGADFKSVVDENRSGSIPPFGRYKFDFVYFVKKKIFFIHIARYMQKVLLLVTYMSMLFARNVSKWYCLSMYKESQQVNS